MHFRSAISAALRSAAHPVNLRQFRRRREGQRLRREEAQQVVGARGLVTLRRAVRRIETQRRDARHAAQRLDGGVVGVGVVGVGVVGGGGVAVTFVDACASDGVTGVAW